MVDPPQTESVQAVAKSLRDLGVFASIPLENLERLARSGKLVRLEMGRELLHKGRMAKGFFILLKGRLRVLGQAGSSPETIELIGPGGIVGWYSMRLDAPLETVAAAEESICLWIPADVDPDAIPYEFAESLETRIWSAEVYDLLTMEFGRRAMDTADLRDCLRQVLAQVRVASHAKDCEDPCFLWLIAEGPDRGHEVGRDTGAKRILGFPKDAFREIETIAMATDSSLELGHPITSQDALPSIDHLIERQTVFPEVTTAERGIEEVVACFEILSKFHHKSLPKDALRKVLHNELRDGKPPTFHICGTVAAIAGYSAQLVEFPANSLPRLDTTSVILWKDGLTVLFPTKGGESVLSSPQSGIHRIPGAELVSSQPENTQALLLTPLPDESEGKFGLRWFIPAVKKHKRALIEVFIASFFVQLFALANPLLTQVIIDKVLVQNSLETLNVLGVLFVAVAVAGVALTALRTYLFVDTTNRIDLALGTKIMDHLYRVTLGYFHRRPVGEISSRLQELENIRQFLTGTALTVGLDAVFSVIYIGIMLFYDVGLTLVALAALPFMGLITVAVSPLLRRQLRERAQHMAHTQAHLVETITGIQTVKAQNLEHHSRQKWQNRYAGYVSAGFRAVVTSTAMGSTTSLLSRLGDLGVLWYGAVLVIDGKMTLGQLIAFRIIAGYVTSPLVRLTQSWQSFQEVGLSIERLGDVLDQPPEQSHEEAKNIPMPTVDGRVTFDRVTFSYVAGQQPQLRNVSFEVPAGSFVGVVGRSGSGKSTLLKLLPRLYRTDEGRILVDGYEIAKVELNSLRRQIATVLQDSLLFNESMMSNIAVANPDATPEEIIRAARLAEAHDFIMDLPQGYNTPAGEQGRAISGGQRQRVAIARAILQRPRMLIFDEATSALDFATERKVCQNLAKEFQGRTVFFVTHRVRSIQHADLILVLDKGSLVEHGTHDELMARRSLYFDLHNQQEDAQ
jgi:subfamily B ATP-binding cassette protein HlyB/CyaB